MKTKPIDVIIYPRLEKSWIHFDVEAKGNKGELYYHRSSNYGSSYDPPYPSFPFYAGENYFTDRNPHGYTLEPFDIDKLIKERLHSHEWRFVIKSIKFSNQVYVCPKTYIVWESTDEYHTNKSISHFEIKKLNKKEKNIRICREQYDDLWKYRNGLI